MPHQSSDSKNTLTRWLNALPWALAIFLFALRFALLGDTVYVLDEPYFQLKIDENFAQNIFPLTSFRGSSIPLPYGAGGLWFYSLIRLFTWHPISIALYHLTAQLLGALLFLWTLYKAYGARATGWCALLVASSPLLFFLSRHPWDNTLLIPTSALALYFLQKLREQPSRPMRWHIGLGLVIGYGLNIHLMFGPVAVALGITLALQALRQRNWRALIPVIAFGAVAFATLAPYLWEAARLAKEEKAFEHATIKNRWGDGRNLWWLFQRTTLFSSVFSARIYLDDVRATFYPYLGSFWTFFVRNDLFGWFGKIAAWVSAFSVIFSLARFRIPEDPLRLFAGLTFLFALLVFQYLNIPTAPHYFNPMWWFVFLGIAWAITELRGHVARVFIVTIALTGLINIVFDLHALAYVHENKGARNMQTSVVVSEQMRAIAEICQQAKDRKLAAITVDLTGTYLASPAFLFLPKHMPECLGISVQAGQNLVGPTFRLKHPQDSNTKVDILVEMVNP